jgi:hypothetical protein
MLDHKIEKKPRADYSRVGFVVLLAVWLRGFLPGATNYLTEKHVSFDASVQVLRSGISQTVANATQVILILTLLFALLQKKPSKSDRSLDFSFLLIVTWAVLSFGSRWWYEGVTTASLIDFLTFVILALVLKGFQWNNNHLFFVGSLGILSISFSLLLGLLRPDLASFPGPEKNPFANFLLAGSFGHANSLGLAAVLTTPFLVYVVKKHLWYIGIVTCLIALGWSGSRTAYLGAAVMVLILIFSRVTSNKLAIRSLAVLTASLATILLPLLTTDPQLFTGRGRIWMESLQEAQHSIIWGLGSNWYENRVRYVNELGTQATSGHNLFVHSFTTGGLLLTAAIGLVILRILARQKSFGESRSTVGYWLAGLMTICIAEFPLVASIQSDVFFYTTLPVIIFSLGNMIKSVGD